MSAVIVTCMHQHARRESEVGFTDLDRAIAFADAVIENDGAAHVDIYLATGEVEPPIPKNVLCDVYIH